MYLPWFSPWDDRGEIISEYVSNNFEFKVTTEFYSLNLKHLCAMYAQSPPTSTGDVI